MRHDSASRNVTEISMADPIMDSVNNKAFNRAQQQYAKAASSGLTPQEFRCLHVIPEHQRGAILDIGIGAGRTTGPLAAMFRSYEGIDYAEQLVGIAKKNYPHLNLRVMDARTLDACGTYDCILFSFNGLDYIGYADRIRFLGAAFRALKPGGYLLYSTHNAGHSRAAVYTRTLFVREQIIYIVKPWRLLQMLRNRIRNFHRQWRPANGHFSVINDAGVRFGLLTVYVDIPAEIEVLRRYGFAVDLTIGCGKTDGYDANDAWVYIMAKKSALPPVDIT